MQPPVWSGDASLLVVMAANGYPGNYAKGTTIEGLREAATSPNARVFHAGTAWGPPLSAASAASGPASATHSIVANGGRVLGVAATGPNVSEAQRRAYAAVDRVHWPEGFCRRDIGWKAVAREKAAAALVFASRPAGAMVDGEACDKVCLWEEEEGPQV